VIAKFRDDYALTHPPRLHGGRDAARSAAVNADIGLDDFSPEQIQAA